MPIIGVAPANTFNCVAVCGWLSSRLHIVLLTARHFFHGLAQCSGKSWESLKTWEMRSSTYSLLVSRCCLFSLSCTENVSRQLISMWKIAAHLGWSPMRVFLLFLFRVSKTLLLFTMDSLFSPFVLSFIWQPWQKYCFYSLLKLSQSKRCKFHSIFAPLHICKMMKFCSRETDNWVNGYRFMCRGKT